MQENQCIGWVTTQWYVRPMVVGTQSKGNGDHSWGSPSRFYIIKANQQVAPFSSQQTMKQSLWESELDIMSIGTFACWMQAGLASWINLGLPGLNWSLEDIAVQGARGWKPVRIGLNFSSNTKILSSCTAICMTFEMPCSQHVVNGSQMTNWGNKLL